MGIIYICKSLHWGDVLAFKGLNKIVIDTPEADSRLQREAELWFEIAKHPNIVTLRFMCVILNRKYLVMDAILPRSPRGNTLASWMKKEKKLNLETTLNFAIQICNGMIHASHEYEKRDREFIHADLHPGNILIDEKSEKEAVLKITDFGLVRDQKTWSQKYMGTFKYTACERWNNSQEIDQRADIYSFGCLIYLMLTGHPPFYGLNRIEYHQAHCGKEPDPPFDIDDYESPGMKELTDFVLKCLKKNPEDRYFDFTECLVDLMRYYFDIFGRQVIIDKNVIKLNAIDYFFRGFAYMVMDINHLKDAEETFRKALEIKPKFEQAWAKLGNVLVDQNRLKEAEDIFRKALEIDQNFADVWHNLGNLFQKQKQPKEAEDAYRKALKIDPNDSKKWYNLGILLQEQKRPNETEKAYRNALQIDPNDAKTWYNLGTLLKDQKHFNEAEYAYRKFLEIDPHNAKTWNNLGFLLVDQKHPKEAEEAYKKSLEIDPNDSETWNNFGNLLVEQKRLNDAENAYLKALEIEPNNADVWHNFGMLSKDQKRPKEAEKSFKKTLKINPKDILASNNLGILLGDQGRYLEAGKIYREILNFTKNHALTYYNYACLYGLQSKVSESIKYLKLEIEEDLKYKKMARTDKDFDLIRDTPEFRELLK